MTRDDWERFEKLQQTSPDVQFAMQARCEEQGHEWDFGVTVLFRGIYRCKWCGRAK